MKLLRTGVILLLSMLWAIVAGLVFADPASARVEVTDTAGATQLRAKYVALRDQLADSPFQRPLALNSIQSPGSLKGDVYALVDHPFPKVGSALDSAESWCDVLILHLNVKHCSVAPGAGGDILTAHLGKKHSQPLSQTHQVPFRYRVAANSPNYLQVRLGAQSGPFGTSDYEITLEAIPLDAARTFLHLSYAYKYGPAAALAMRAYFSTAGSEKVGFTVVDRTSEGRPVRVGDVRGALERNTMRYFLAIDAYLGASSAAPEAQLERRLRDWFAATERYPQLHELEQDEYLEMKRGECRRLRAQI
jgi:hypothetical protein